MLRKWVSLIPVVVVVAACAPAWATSVALYADSAPNDGTYAAWWTAAKTDVSAVTFIDMRNGTFPGTTKFDPYDAIVYDTGNGGKRLQWIYWLPGQAVSALAGLFQVRDVYDWGGVSYAYDFTTGDSVPTISDPEAGWIQPSSWTNYLGGVIGTWGDAYVANDDLAPPPSTDADPYNEVDQADINAARAIMLASQTFWTGEVRFRTSTDSPWQVTSLPLDEVAAIPEPLTLLGVFAGVVGLGRYVRRRRVA